MIQLVSVGIAFGLGGYIILSLLGYSFYQLFKIMS